MGIVVHILSSRRKLMKVKIERITENPVELIYKHYRMCYAPNIDKIELAKHDTLEKKMEFIKPLMSDAHGTPLESVQVTFEVTGVTRALLAQITRHRAGVSFNVMSQRYVDGKNFDFIIPNLDYIDDYETRAWAETEIEAIGMEVFDTYNRLVEAGVKKEDARAILPMNTTCNFYVTFNLRSLRHFLGLRLCTHAQREIRELAGEMLRLTQSHVPFIGYKVMNCGRMCNQCRK